MWFNPRDVTRRTLLPLIASLAIVLGACTVGVSPQPQPGPGGITLSVPEPERIDWRRTVGGFEISGVDTKADPAELALLARALEELPDELVAAAGVRRFYRVPVGDSPHGTAGYAVGPDIYLIDETFRDLGNGMTTFDLVRLLAHEMVHTAQFAMLTSADIERVADVGLDDPIPTSSFVASFADRVGWVDRGRATGLPDWVLPSTAGATDYGTTAPEEDMAESVADIVSGVGPSVSSDRRQWVAEWLGASVGRLRGGRPWAPAGSERILTEQPLYDEEEVARQATGEVEVVSFAIPVGAGALSQISRNIETALSQSGVAGTFAPVLDDRIGRVGGLFTRGDGATFWVEIWDFRNAPGFVDPAPRPVVTYVVLWR